MLDEQQTITVRVRFFASARAAAGVDSEHLQLAPAASVRDALERLRDAHPGRLDEILRAASFLVDGVAVRDPAMPLPAGAQLDVLPPFAGG